MVMMYKHFMGKIVLELFFTHSILTAKQFFLHIYKFSCAFSIFRYISMIAKFNSHLVFYLKNNQSSNLKYKKYASKLKIIKIIILGAKNDPVGWNGLT